MAYSYTQTPLFLVLGALTILMLSLEVQAITGTGGASIATAYGTFTPTKPTSTGGHRGSGTSGASSTAGPATGSSVALGSGVTTAPQLAVGVLAMFVGYAFAL